MTPAALRIGCVRYLNAKPLIDGWPGEVEFDHPAALCEKLARGEFDVALVSSFEYLRNPIYTIVDGVSISSDGPVYSVFLAHRDDLSKIESVEADPASATSVNLLRSLFAENGFAPKFTSPNASSIAGKSARLLIGDQAIRFRQEKADRYSYWDLGEQWEHSLGLPFVFALWLIHPAAKAAEKIADRLRARRDANLLRLREIAGQQTDFAPDFCAKYFTEFIRYGFGAREKEGLLRFRSLCEKHGILSSADNALRLA